MTIAESLHRKWNAHEFLPFRMLCGRLKRKYSYECDIFKLNFTHTFTFKDGSSLTLTTKYDKRDTHYFCEVQNG